MTFKGKHHSLETKLRISEALNGPRNHNWGKDFSSETREKMREAKIGKPGPWLGKQHSYETKMKISEAKKGFVPWNKGKHLAPEYCQKLSKAKQGVVISSWFQKGENHPNWRGGISIQYCHKFNTEFKERVRAFWYYQCGLCKKSQKENGRSLPVHHVLYEKETCCGKEIPRYFIPLCNSCHAKTNFNREHWQKIFSKKINQKFKGKCYFHKGEVLPSWGAMVQ